MSIVQTLWRAQITSVRSAGRYDMRMRVAFVFILAFDIAVGAWSGSQLIAHIHQWKVTGPLAVSAGLWSICLLTWAGMMGITVLESLLQGMGDDLSLLLFTLPIPAASRFRALYSMFFLRRLWNWLLLETGITGTALFVTLGWRGLSWLALLQLGVGCVVYGSMLAAMLFARYILPRGQVKTGIAGGILLGFVILLVMVVNRFPLQIPEIKPELVCLLFALILCIVIGPLANLSGRWYVSSFLSVQGEDRSHTIAGIPGTRGPGRLLARYRNLPGGLCVKGLLNSSRSVLFWGRAALVLLALFFFPWVRAALAGYGIADTLFVAGYASGLALLSILEQAPNAISGEGNRLTLYLTAPFELIDILRAKLMVFLLPVLVEGLAFSLVLSWRLGLGISEMGFAALLVVLIIPGCIALPVWGSVWDENLDLAVEGTVQMMLAEEAAVTPKRLGLVNLSLLLFALSLLGVWKLPPVVAIVAIMLLDGLVLAVMLRLSEAQLSRLIRYKYSKSRKYRRI